MHERGVSQNQSVRFYGLEQGATNVMWRSCMAGVHVLDFILDLSLLIL